MLSLRETMQSGREAGHSKPWPRHVIDQTGWLRAIREISKGQGDLLSFWSDGADVHMAILDHESSQIGLISHECPDGVFPSVSRLHPPAMRLERAIQDIYGIAAKGLPDGRPWLDHGRWGVRRPGRNSETSDPIGEAYEFSPAEGAPLHQMPVGPVHAGIIEPGHFRFTANGELVVRLEERLGYVHKGIEQLMVGAPLERGARLAARVSGDSTVAYSLAFAQAVESALEMEVPPRAIWLGALMAEIERLANHFGDIGAICNDASFSLMHAHCGVMRERI